MSSPHTEPGPLEREFDRALELLDARFAARELAIRRHSAESQAAREAWTAYDLARLLLLSCELRLRSRGITQPAAHRRAIRTLVYSPSEMFRDSLALVLRAYGYPTSSIATLPSLRIAIQTQPCAAVVSCLGRRLWHDPLFIEGVVWAAQPVSIFALRGDVGPSTPLTPEHPRIRNVDSIESLVAQLDKAAEAGHLAGRHLVRTGHPTQTGEMVCEEEPVDRSADETTAPSPALVEYPLALTQFRAEPRGPNRA